MLAMPCLCSPTNVPGLLWYKITFTFERCKISEPIHLREDSVVAMQKGKVQGVASFSCDLILQGDSEA